jgi:hypothetical protein
LDSASAGSQAGRHRGRRLSGHGAADGNERLTNALALVLFALLGADALTTLDLSAYVPVHLFLGLVLLPAVSLKLASTSWRAARYHTRNRVYRHLPRVLRGALDDWRPKLHHHRDRVEDSR